jgi:hypothetical protein
MIGRPLNNQSTNSARFYPIWRWHTYARNSQKSGKSHQNGRDLLGIIRPMLLPKPNQTARNIQMSHLYQPTLGPKTGVQTPPFAKSP